MSITKKGSKRASTEAEKVNIPKAPIPSREGDPARPKIIGEQIWCPLCNEYTQFIKSANAAKLASVHRRTIYRYIEEGSVYTVKIAGKSYRVCSSCLLRQAR
jgi:excisionase family DNA binding protein